MACCTDATVCAAVTSVAAIGVALQVDCVLFAHLVDLKDSVPTSLKHKSYEQLFKDVRQCVDLCHRDGVIKDRVAEVIDTTSSNWCYCITIHSYRMQCSTTAGWHSDVR
jgi:5' nucleotidase family